MLPFVSPCGPPQLPCKLSRHARRFGPRAGRHPSFTSCSRIVRHFGPPRGPTPNMSTPCASPPTPRRPTRHVRHFGPRVDQHNSFASSTGRGRRPFSKEKHGFHALRAARMRGRDGEHARAAVVNAAETNQPLLER